MGRLKEFKKTICSSISRSHSHHKIFFFRDITGFFFIKIGIEYRLRDVHPLDKIYSLLVFVIRRLIFEMTLISSLLSPTIIVVGLISLAAYYWIRNRKSRTDFAKLPQPSGKVPVLGHSLLLLKKGVDITESAFAAFYKYAVEFHQHGLYAFDLFFQPSVFIFAPEHFEKVRYVDRIEIELNLPRNF